MIIEEYLKGRNIDYLQFFSFPLECFKDELSCIFVEGHLWIPWYLHGGILDLSFTICNKRNSITHIIFPLVPHKTECVFFTLQFLHNLTQNFKPSTFLKHFKKMDTELTFLLFYENNMNPNKLNFSLRTLHFWEIMLTDAYMIYFGLDSG